MRTILALILAITAVTAQAAETVIITDVNEYMQVLQGLEAKGYRVFSIESSTHTTVYKGNGKVISISGNSYPVRAKMIIETTEEYNQRIEIQRNAQREATANAKQQAINKVTALGL